MIQPSNRSRPISTITTSTRPIGEAGSITTTSTRKTTAPARPIGAATGSIAAALAEVRALGEATTTAARTITAGPAKVRPGQVSTA